MGQAPTRPSQQERSNLHSSETRQEAGMDLSHLPAFSPLKRVSKAPASGPTDPPTFDSTLLVSRSASRLSSDGRQVRKRDGRQKSHSRRTDRERTNLNDVKVKTAEGARRKRRTIKRGTGQAAPVSPADRLGAIPRIDIVASSPLLGAAPANEQTYIDRDAHLASAASPAPPSFPRSPSMPVVLQEPSPSYSLPPATSRPVLERPISSPHLSSDYGLAPQIGMLPLPGTPICDLILAERPQQDYLEAVILPANACKPVSSAQVSSLPASRTASVHHTDDCDSVDSVVTQQIKIFRVTNPDIGEEETAGAELLGGPATVDNAGKRTLAEKRKVSAPPALMTPMTPQKASLLSPSSAKRLSPTTPSSATSSSYNNSSSGLLSPSTAATSLSPTSPRDKPNKTSLYPVRAAPPVPGSVAPGALRSFLISRTARKSSTERVKSKTGDDARSGALSGDSSNADESGECSTVSAISDEEATEIRRRKARQGARHKIQKSKGRVASGKGDQSRSKTRCAEKLERRASGLLPVPPINLLDIDDCDKAQSDWRRVSVGTTGHTLAPISPRPAATPFFSPGQLLPAESYIHLPEPGTPGQMPSDENRPGVRVPETQQTAYFLPPPPSLQMDGFTHELLSRCGVEVEASLPLLGGKTSLISHPSILRPTSLASLRLPSERRIVSLPIDFVSAPPRELLVEAGAVIEQDSLREEEGSKEPSNSVIRHERAARRAEKAARYEAFRQLALMAVESPQGNPYVELSTGAVRLGEYKRGFDGYEIERWAQKVQQAVREEDVADRRAGRRVRKEYV